eukprot:30708-Pelagococcus_subviridis.AAC.6
MNTMTGTLNLDPVARYNAPYTAPLTCPTARSSSTFISSFFPGRPGGGGAIGGPGFAAAAVGLLGDLPSTLGRDPTDDFRPSVDGRPDPPSCDARFFSSSSGVERRQMELKGVRGKVERRRGRGLKARCGRRDTPGKVLKDRRPPRRRGRTGTSVR